MKKLYPYIFIALAFLFLSSCEDIFDSDQNYKKSLIEDPGKYSNVIQPLSVGSSWEYGFAAYDDKGSAIALFKEKRSLLKDTVMEGIQWHTFDSTGNVWLTNESDGLHSMSVLDSNKGKDFLIIKFPANKGDVFRNLGWTWTVISTDTTVKVKAGAFKCYRYEAKGDDNSVTNVYYSPGVGFIKQETTIDNEISHLYYTTIISELTKYRIK